MLRYIITTKVGSSRVKTMLSSVSPIGLWLKEKRVAAGFTIRGFVKHSGVPKAQISRIESGKYAPTLFTLVRICNGLGIGLYELSLPLETPYIQEIKNLRQKNNNNSFPKKFSAQDVIAFVDLSNTEEPIATAQLVDWIANSLEEYNQTTSKVAHQKAEEYLSSIENEKGFPYPPHLSIEETKNSLIPKSAITIYDAAAFLRKVRKEKAKITIEELAEKTNIPFSTISRIERGTIKKIKFDDILVLDESLNAFGVAVALFWDAAIFHTGLWAQSDSRVRYWGETEFTRAQTFIKTVRWMEATFPEDKKWLENLRIKIEPYYMSFAEKRIAGFVSSYGPDELAVDIYDAISPYISEHKLQMDNSKTIRSLPEPIRRVWNKILEKCDTEVVYAAVVADFLRAPANPDIQSAFRFYTKKMFTGVEVLEIKNILDQLQ